MFTIGGASLFVRGKEIPLESITLPGVEYDEHFPPRAMGPIELTAEVEPEDRSALMEFFEALRMPEILSDAEILEATQRECRAMLARLKTMGSISDYETQLEDDGTISIFCTPQPPLLKVNMRHWTKLPPGESTRRNRRRRRGRARARLEAMVASFR